MRPTPILLALLLIIGMTGCSGDQVTGPTADKASLTSLSEELVTIEARHGGRLRGGAKLVARLSGDNEVHPADPDGRGMIVLRLNPGQERICYALRLSGIEPPMAMHIHRAVAGENGPVVVALSVDDPFRMRGCVDANRDLIKEILRNPADFYVNVHNAEFPPGAIRGQLAKPGRRDRP